MQTTLRDGLWSGPFSFCQIGWPTAEGHIGRRQVVQAFVVSLLIVILDKPLDLFLQIAVQRVVLQQYLVLQTLAPVLDPALRSRMKERATNMTPSEGAHPTRRETRHRA